MKRLYTHRANFTGPSKASPGGRAEPYPLRWSLGWVSPSCTFPVQGGSVQGNDLCMWPLSRALNTASPHLSLLGRCIQKNRLSALLSTALSVITDSCIGFTSLWKACTVASSWLYQTGWQSGPKYTTFLECFNLLIFFFFGRTWFLWSVHYKL